MEKNGHRFLRLVFLCGSVLLLTSTSHAKSTVRDCILQNEVRISGSVPTAPQGAPVMVITEVHQSKRLVDANFVSESVRLTLDRHGVRAIKFSGDFSEALQEKRLTHRELLSRKFVVDIAVQSDNDRGGFSASCTLSYFEYRKEDGSRMRAVQNWSGSRDIRGLSDSEIESILVKYVQDETARFADENRKGRHRNKDVFSRGRGRKQYEGGDEVLSYSLRWKDPKGTSPALQIGIAVGTPALANVYLGIMNIGGLPLNVGASGMYLDRERRGIQFEAGVTLNRESRLKHMIALTATGFNERTPILKQSINEYGGIEGTGTGNIDVIRFYYGPAYVANWRDIRLQVSAGFHPGEPARILFQFGYTPRLGF